MNQCSQSLCPWHSLQKSGLRSFFNKLRRLTSNGFRHFIVNFSNCLQVEYPILNKTNDYIQNFVNCAGGLVRNLKLRCESFILPTS